MSLIFSMIHIANGMILHESWF